MALEPAKVDEVVRLVIQERLTYRAAAAKTGVGRSTVAAIVNRLALTGAPYATGKKPSRPSDEPYFNAKGPDVRCPTCGTVGKQPCHLCFVRGSKA